MLEALKFTHVGPAPTLAIDFKERLNFLAGDNGLGKSFLLDVAWWALTRTWARRPMVPHLPPAEPSIFYRYLTKTGRTHEYTSTFNRESEWWSIKQGRPAVPGLVIYAQVDSGFSVWDPARNYWKKDDPDRPQSYLFTAAEVWEGNTLCEGLIRDWASWQRENGETFKQLKSVLRALSPSHLEQLIPGELRKVSLDDPKRYPTLKMPYGEDVALIHASAGMRRIVALAYLLVWTWQEHLEACKLRGDAPAEEIVFLIDEVETHLHPEWQRRVVPALLKVMQSLTANDSDDVRTPKTQLITATHSPLVLASSEALFDETRDGVFLLDLKDGSISLREQPWAKQGDVVGWLVSNTFGLKQGRSLDAERAIEAAEAWMRGDKSDLPDGLTSEEKIHQELVRILAGHDPFWPRWIIKREASAGGEE
ncbi:MAG: ATP-binding protein [Deltaproteobacteria bacterium]|nr:ATP-binding protein [Deltaproteobacteria bacterium]